MEDILAEWQTAWNRTKRRVCKGLTIMISRIKVNKELSEPVTVKFRFLTCHINNSFQITLSILQAAYLLQQRPGYLSRQASIQTTSTRTGHMSWWNVSLQSFCDTDFYLCKYCKHYNFNSTVFKQIIHYVNVTFLFLFLVTSLIGRCLMAKKMPHCKFQVFYTNFKLSRLDLYLDWEFR